ncbi:MAG: EcsC family protein [Oscillospiraceae bacterium]|jgi:hypothetical protein|nr:EcsC family protein [Oscillospiraceae bacterium]
MNYNKHIQKELEKWEHSIRLETKWQTKAKSLQEFTNSLLPKSIQDTITDTMEKFISAVMNGSQIITNFSEYDSNSTLSECDFLLTEKFKEYKRTAVVEGGITGAGGLLLGLADLPALLSVQIKFLFEAAAIYGYNTYEESERLFLLYIFQLTYSSREHRIECYNIIRNWTGYKTVDWTKLQMEYRDYLDFAKMLQLVPIIGAPVGMIANGKLMEQLRTTVMNSFRLRKLNANNHNIVAEV